VASGAVVESGTKVASTALRPALEKPELLAPAGTRECLIAAIENGADAVYFGVQAHNARARAANFALTELPEIMAALHRRGLRGYVTLNTLIFPTELDGVEAVVREVVRAGVDAVIVQDLGLCRLIRALTPDLEIHASTQMSVTSSEGLKLAEELGCSRVILARELSLREIGRIRTASMLPVEVFVHGALCVAYSGQCLTSEALGARSANRGECAQACRMEYQVVRDGEPLDLGDIRYLLSPKDLAAFELVPRLIELGVSSLKIEGRLKSAEYVASITQSYRKAIDEAWAGRPVAFCESERQDMELTFSRGFSHGFLDGTDHKALVRGDYAKKRGLFLGRVKGVSGSVVRLDLAAPVKPGDGIVFDGMAEPGIPEQGGRVYQVYRPARGRFPSAPQQDGLSTGPAELAFGRRDIDLRQVRIGQRVWKTDDPQLTRRLRASFEGPARRTRGLAIEVVARVGEPLCLVGRTAGSTGITVSSPEPLAAATSRPATEEEIRVQLERLGGTAYHLEALQTAIEGGPLVPRSLLNTLRRQLVEQLDALSARPPDRLLADGSVLPQLRAEIRDRARADRPDLLSRPVFPFLVCLCRNTPQALAAIEAGVRQIYLDYHEIKEYGPAVAAIRGAAPDGSVFLAPPRIEKPGEGPIFRFLMRHQPDGLLARNAGSLRFCAARGIPFVADFSFNAANELTVAWLQAKGARRVTASYDLSFDQLDNLLRAIPPTWLEVVIHQHMPMFHMEHCVFCAVLSPGTNKTNCGRPCDRHDVKLRDRVGMEHPLQADVACRNTLYNAVAQTAAEYLPRLVERGAGALRIEFLDDSPDAVGRIVAAYRGTLDGHRDPRTLWKELKATNRYGVTRGQLAVIEA
jgi:putative protease